MENSLKNESKPSCAVIPSLRDYLAGQAMNGILSNSDLLAKMQGNTEENDLMAARTAYRIADCMIKVRSEF